MQNATIPIPHHQQPELKEYFKIESESMTFEASERREIKILRANVAILIAEHSRNANLDAYIPYLAMIYFDHYISRNNLPTLGNQSVDYRIHALALGCLSTAWNMKKKEHDTNKYMDNISNLSIDEGHVKMVETEIRKVVYVWFTDLVNAIRYVPFFLSLVEDAGNSDCWRFKSDVNELIIKSQRDINFTQFKPSVIAASAIFCILGAGSGKLFGNDLKMNKDKIFDCWTKMMKIHNEIIPKMTAQRKISEGVSEIEEVDRMNFELKWTWEILNSIDFD